MEIILSTPRELQFMDNFQHWLKEQTDRLWIITPFVDKIGVSLLNSAGNALDMKLITRRNKELVNIKSDLTLKMMPEVHTKVFIGDREALIGSMNLTTNSLVDNIEIVMKFQEIQVVEKLAKYFEVLWVRLL